MSSYFTKQPSHVTRMKVPPTPGLFLDEESNRHLDLHSGSSSLAPSSPSSPPQQQQQHQQCMLPQPPSPSTQILTPPMESHMTGEEPKSKYALNLSAPNLFNNALFSSFPTTTTPLSLANVPPLVAPSLFTASDDASQHQRFDISPHVPSQSRVLDSSIYQQQKNQSFSFLHNNYQLSRSMYSTTPQLAPFPFQTEDCYSSTVDPFSSDLCNNATAQWPIASQQPSLFMHDLLVADPTMTTTTGDKRRSLEILACGGKKKKQNG
ncbi:hypothetical protein BCR42DRAFT_70739 [Absidia repens]|uniref:Uncharacterized protein n=1 Tax=Absidia repens TaxID=90262 RepID=A0A1X2IAW2_9FUNG|nr:hypothetical protein BCR42DRAFT_70739 [Absidia repens]